MVWRGLLSWGPLGALVLLCIAFGVADPEFATLGNLQTIASRSAVPLILAVGLTFVIVQGSIDLSLEGLMAVSSLTFALCVLNSRTGSDLEFLGIVVATAVGAGFGVVNGFLVTRLRVPSFMATLGIWSFTGGVAMLLSGGNPPLVRDETLRVLGLGQTLGMPNLALIALLCLALGYFLQERTRFGRYSYVIGGGEDLARLSGIAVERFKMLVFAFSGCLAGLAGALEFGSHRHRSQRSRSGAAIRCHHRGGYRRHPTQRGARRRPAVGGRSSDHFGSRQRDDLCRHLALPPEGSTGGDHPSRGGGGDLAHARAPEGREVSETVLRVEGLSKRYPGVQALNHVTLEVRRPGSCRSGRREWCREIDAPQGSVRPRAS